MKKHVEDGGDLSLILSDQGELLVICQKCGQKWIGHNFVPLSQANASSKRRLYASLESRPSLMRRLGIDDSDFL